MVHFTNDETTENIKKRLKKISIKDHTFKNTNAT